ncbi:YggT family protein [Terricaulis sp.]|uniref:YggT family protein n=1 Tax=Terricaulis sp. TaxID=2768686 RepID=UPI003784FC14
MGSSDSLLFILFRLVAAIIELFVVVLIVYVIISWLYAFDVVSRRNGFISGTWEFCRRVCDPVLRPLRGIIPPIAGVDLSVLIVILAIQLLILPLWWWFFGVLVGR